MTVQGAFETQAEEDVNALLVRVEAGDWEEARDVVNRCAEDGLSRLAWLVLQLAAMLHAQEVINEGMERALEITQGIAPAGLSRTEIATIALESDRRREAQPTRRAPKLMEGKT